MPKTTQIVVRWLPAVLIMLLIFLVSAQASSTLPDFDWADRIVKKSGHMIGYAMLSISYWRFFLFKREKWWIAWCFALLYAASDEFHQSFVPGRNASVWDVMVFDNFGALLGLWFFNLHKIQRPDLIRPIVEKVSAKD